MSDSEWVQLLEPTKKRMVYANITTGECSWNPPVGATYQPASDDQWWELRDPSTGKPYYFNASTGITVWGRPASGHIVALAKLQEAQQHLASSPQKSQRPSVSTGSSAQPVQQQPVQQQQQYQEQQQQQASAPVHTAPQPAQQPIASPAQSAAQTPVNDPQRHASLAQMLRREPSTDQSLLSSPRSQSLSTTPTQGRGPPPAPPGPTPRVNFGEVHTGSPALSDMKEKLSTHKKGLFRRKVSLHNMLAWDRDVIPRPMLLTLRKEQKKAAIDMFKLVQQFMGDRGARSKDAAQTAQDIVRICWDEADAKLRDELFLQLCKQTNSHPKVMLCEKGWELMVVALSFFPPTHNFIGYLRGYIARHADSTAGDIAMLAQTAFKRLERVSKTGRKQGASSPSLDDIQSAITRIRNPSVFGSSLEEVMELQQASHPDLPFPFVLQVLSNAVLHLEGTRTEGIFRVPGDIDGVNALRLKMDRGEEPSGLSDPHVPASTLKLWFRELTEPLVPAELYEHCIASCYDTAASVATVDQLPPTNRAIVLFIVRFLQTIGQEENQPYTKMTYDNLSMVWAPNFLRCPSEDPMVIFNNTKKEMNFVRQLVLHLDTQEAAPFFT
eukprot:m.40958 g.40958  ORF g.40958 m.40958 type:complete len:610 (+) comp10491_c0_seq1:149-1978(+)